MFGAGAPLVSQLKTFDDQIVGVESMRVVKNISELLIAVVTKLAGAWYLPSRPCRQSC